MAAIYTTPVEPFEPRGRSLMETHPQDDGTDDDNLAASILSSAPKISTKYNSSRGAPSKKEEIWTIREVPNGEEQLYAKGKCVYWTRNSLIIKSFNFTDQVVRPFWSQFEGRDHVCIALASGLSVFDQIGQHFQILLPFDYKEMYSTRRGLIIERNCDPSEDSSLPVLFSLTHPTREISPILLKPLEDEVTYSMPDSTSVVDCHDMYCLMYNSEDRQHSIWRTRQTTSEEQDEFAPSSPVTARSRHSALSNLAASRLGAGCGPTATEFKSFNSAQTFNTKSTPSKSRTINYLRDNIEFPILSETTLEHEWTEPTVCDKANKFFWTTDLLGKRYIVIVISAKNQLNVIRSEKFGDTELSLLGGVSHIAASDAAPIAAMNMMIVIDVNKNFVLYSGRDRITQVAAPQSPPTTLRNMPTSSPATFKHPNMEMSPIQASSARKRFSTGERNSVGSEISFQHMFHGLSPVPHAIRHETKSSSPACLSDAKKIEHVIGQTIYILNANAQRTRVEVPSICQTPYVEFLIDSMKALVLRDPSLSIIGKWYQTRRASNQPEYMKADKEMNLFKNWFLSCLGIETNLFGDDSFTSLDMSMKVVQPSPEKKSRRSRDTESNPILTNIHTLFYAMHLVFEDLLLMKLNYGIASSLAELLLVLACALKLNDYQEHYWLKFPHLQDKYGPQRSFLANLIPKSETLQKPPFFTTEPPSIVDFINKIVSCAKIDEIRTLNVYPVIRNVTDNSLAIISLFFAMFKWADCEPVIELSLSSNSLNHSLNQLLNIKPKRSARADEEVVETMVRLGKKKNYLYSLPEGFTLYLWDAILNCRESPPTDWPEACYDLMGRMDLVNLVRGRGVATIRDENFNNSEDETLKLLFPDDIRVSEAHRMLASDSPVEFSVAQRQGATEEESRDESHRHLYLLNVRTMAMPVGRGAMCLRSYSPVIGESFEVPRLELGGRILPEERPIEYTHDISVYPWPFFHNGVSAGLTIRAASANNIIDSTWINYNRPRSNIPHGTDVRDRDLTAANINNEHAGFLFALGLNGHLEKLSLMALHDYLCQNNDLTKLAILLGMSAAKRGSKDVNIIKVLSIHVDALLPPNSTELDVPAPVHAASIIGVGLLYQGSGDSHISRVLLEEIGRLPGPEANSHIDRESYSLSAGLAFGLVNLCKGGSSTISSSDQLRLYMIGGKRKPLTAAQKERYFKQDRHRGEEEYINTHITSPGGTLGLGLMYHRTSNESVANWMRAPDTQTLLEYVRPDFLILRMLSYGLIMWKEIQPNEDYINRHIPKIVSTHAFQRNTAPTLSGIDYELISQAYCNIVTGCCMAISMRYAGTADPGAYKTIYKHMKMMIALSDKPALVEQAGRPCIEACLNVLVTSLAVVMAGTGDLGVLRVCRYLRSRLTQTCVFYGCYMAVHIALGILFLGACRYSLSTSPESIGALVCALYPIYPNHSSDNHYHLQALRHLYVLAAEPRLIIPRDILTNKPVYVSLTVKIRSESGQIVDLKLRAPCLMPEVESVENVCVDDKKYWRIEINNRESLTQCLFKHHGHLSVKQKAHPTNDPLVVNFDEYILQNLPDGVIKSRKTRALNACVEEDRVDQFSALNELLTKTGQRDPRFLCLQLNQLRLAQTLASEKITDKINLLCSVVCEFESKLGNQDIEMKWMDYISKTTDWTNTSTSVAHYIALNDLNVFSSDVETIKLIKELKF